MNFTIATSVALTPHHQSFFGGFFLSMFLLFVNIDNNFLYLKKNHVFVNVITNFIIHFNNLWGTHTWNLRIMVQIKPRINRGFPSTMSSAPMDSRRTLVWRKACKSICILLWIGLLTLILCYSIIKLTKHLFTFSILCTRILPEFGLPNRSPDMISKSLIRYFPSDKSVKRSLIWKQQ